MRSYSRGTILFLATALLVAAMADQARAKRDFGGACNDCHGRNRDAMDLQGSDTMWGGRPTFTVMAGDTTQFRFNVDNPANHYALSVFPRYGSGALDPSNQLVSTGDPSWDHRTNGGRDRPTPRDYYHTPDRYSGTRTFDFNLTVDSSTPEDYYLMESQIGGGDEDWAEAERFYLHVLPDVRTTLIPAGATGWGYLDNGSNQGTAWRGPGYDERHPPWETGQAKLGYGNDGEVTEVDYGPNPDDKYVTTYFRKWFDVPGKFATNLTLRMIYDDGAAVYLNGERINLEDLNLDDNAAFDDHATDTRGDPEETAWENIALIDPSMLISGANLIAVEIHQTNATSSDIGFDLELRGEIVPEPSTLALLLSAFGALVLLLRHRRRT